MNIKHFFLAIEEVARARESRPVSYVRNGRVILSLNYRKVVVYSLTLPSVTHAKRYNRTQLGGAAIQAQRVGKLRYADNCQHGERSCPRSDL